MPHNMDLVYGLYSFKLANNRSLVPLGVIITTLMKTDAYENGINLLLRLIEAKNARGERENALPVALTSDPMTKDEDWERIVQLCQEMGHEDIAIELLASLTLKNVLKTAQGYVSELESSENASASVVTVECIPIPDRLFPTKRRSVGFDVEVKDSPSVASTVSEKSAYARSPGSGSRKRSVLSVKSSGATLTADGSSTNQLNSNSSSDTK